MEKFSLCPRAVYNISQLGKCGRIIFNSLRLLSYVMRGNKMILERVQAVVNEISQEFHHRFADKATLIWFGSWVKGTAIQQSDIDLAIEHHGKLTQKKMEYYYE